MTSFKLWINIESDNQEESWSQIVKNIDSMRIMWLNILKTRALNMIFAKYGGIFSKESFQQIRDG